LRVLFSILISPREIDHDYLMAALLEVRRPLPLTEKLNRPYSVIHVSQPSHKREGSDTSEDKRENCHAKSNLTRNRADH